MAFTTKRNPWKQKDEKIAALEAEIAELRLKPMLTMFANQLGNNILTVLASKPYEEWPQHAKDAFAYTATMMPVPAYYYKDRLPKKGK